MSLHPELTYSKATGCSTISKIYLTAEDRANLTTLINLPEKLKCLVDDEIRFANRKEFSWEHVTENGYNVYDDIYYPITWLNSPAGVRNHLDKSPDNFIRLVIRTPAIKTKIPYDFPRVLIGKAYLRLVDAPRVNIFGD